MVFCDKHIYYPWICKTNLPIISLNSQHVKAGQPLEILTGMGEFVNDYRTIVTIGNVQIPLGSDGIARDTIKASGPKGKHIIPVTVSFPKPDGSTATLTKEMTYFVY